MEMKFSIFTQYGQFYIADADLNGDTGHPDFWSKDAFRDRLAITEGILGVSIENDDATANGEIVVHESKHEKTNFQNVDHVVEGSLLVKSGTLQLLDCPTFQAEITIELVAGWYRVRISSFNLAKSRQENPEDTYIIDVWKEPFSEKSVLKRWHSS
ncbi:MAG: hypothetical protein EOP04_24600 [Proteobacteria bacterium]|nr:MAG: hypothetical protein EOP04_24600 [Pseudomonadota bacterium]